MRAIVRLWAGEVCGGVSILDWFAVAHCADALSNGFERSYPTEYREEDSPVLAIL